MIDYAGLMVIFGHLKYEEIVRFCAVNQNYRDLWNADRYLHGVVECKKKQAEQAMSRRGADVLCNDHAYVNGMANTDRRIVKDILSVIDIAKQPLVVVYFRIAYLLDDGYCHDKMPLWSDQDSSTIAIFDQSTPLMVHQLVIKGKWNKYITTRFKKVELDSDQSRRIRHALQGTGMVSREPNNREWIINIGRGSGKYNAQVETYIIYPQHLEELL